MNINNLYGSTASTPTTSIAEISPSQSQISSVPPASQRLVGRWNPVQRSAAGVSKRDERSHASAAGVDRGIGCSG